MKTSISLLSCDTKHAMKGTWMTERLSAGSLKILSHWHLFEINYALITAIGKQKLAQKDCKFKQVHYLEQMQIWHAMFKLFSVVICSPFINIIFGVIRRKKKLSFQLFVDL